MGTVVLQKVQGIPPSWWFPTVTNGLLSLVTVTLVATAPVARFGLESRYRLRAVLQAFLRFWVRVSFFIEAVFGIGNLPLSPCNSTVLTLIPTSSYNIHHLNLQLTCVRIDLNLCLTAKVFYLHY